MSFLYPLVMCSVKSSVDGAGSAVAVDLLVGISCVLAGAFVVK